MSYFSIDGKSRSREIRQEITERVGKLLSRLGRAPRLAVVLVGDDPASKVYVSAKSKQAHECGMETTDLRLPADIAEPELHQHLKNLSSDSSIDGILLQLPLPKSFDEFQALICIDPKLDVDGLHPFNQGLLQRGAKAFRPCTPLGVMDLIVHARRNLGLDARLDGLEAVVLGRSILVGKPVAAMLTEHNCTVTVCHSRTRNLAEQCRRADILVVAIGRPQLVTGEFVKPGAIVIDVGINRLPDGRLVGDVEFDSASQVAAAITPVPGGVGPMTIAMLLRNTLESAEIKVSGGK